MMRLLLVVLSSAWAFRAINAHLGLRHAAATMRAEWAYVDMWLEREPQAIEAPRGPELKRHFQEDAVATHPLRPPLTGDWLDWFGND